MFCLNEKVQIDVGQLSLTRDASETYGKHSVCRSRTGGLVDRIITFHGAVIAGGRSGVARAARCRRSAEKDHHSYTWRHNLHGARSADADEVAGRQMPWATWLGGLH